MPFCLNTSTALIIAPISSRADGMSPLPLQRFRGLELFVELQLGYLQLNGSVDPVRGLALHLLFGAGDQSDALR